MLSLLSSHVETATPDAIAFHSVHLSRLVPKLHARGNYS
jgi:hypothetical protein